MKLYLLNGKDLRHGNSHTKIWSRSLLFLSQSDMTVKCTEDSPYGDDVGLWSNSFLGEHATKLKEVS